MQLRLINFLTPRKWQLLILAAVKVLKVLLQILQTVTINLKLIIYLMHGTETGRTVLRINLAGKTIHGKRIS